MSIMPIPPSGRRRPVTSCWLGLFASGDLDQQTFAALDYVDQLLKSKAGTKAARALILALIGRSQGATLGEIRKTTGWPAHGVRGFLPTAAKKHSLQIESSKTEAGDRVYRIQK